MSKEKKKEMMAKMLDGGKCKDNMMEMMSKMKKGCKEREMPMMSPTMMEMILMCITMELPNMPNEKRIDFVLKMVTTLMEQGSVGMSEEEKKDFVAKVVEKVTTC